MWKSTPNGIIIPITVTPKASRNEIIGWENDALKIRIAAIPDKGCANKELIAFLSKEIGISKSRIELISGTTSRHKRILLKDIKPENVWFLSTS